MARILLVDGVGNAVVVEADADAQELYVGTRRFQKRRHTQEVHGEMLTVYRLEGSGRPKVRHVNRHLATES